MKSQMDDMVFTINGQPMGEMQTVEVEIETKNLEELAQESKWMNEGITMSMTMDIEWEQFDALLKPYSQHFKRIRMPDGKLLTRGKNKWNLNYIK